MANVDFPRGFVPVRHVQGGTNFASQIGDLAAANAEIGQYDLLERRADGFIHPAQAGTTTLIGIANEHKDANSGGTINYIPIDGVIMHAQADGADISAQTDFDLLYDIVATGPNTLTGRSQMEIDSSSKAANAALPLKILRVVEIITQDGNTLGANVLLECVANNGVIKGAGILG